MEESASSATTIFAAVLTGNKAGEVLTEAVRVVMKSGRSRLAGQGTKARGLQRMRKRPGCEPKFNEEKSGGARELANYWLQDSGSTSERAAALYP